MGKIESTLNWVTDGVFKGLFLAIITNVLFFLDLSI